MENTLQAIATVFSLVNPFVCVAMFSHIEQGHERAAKIKDATKFVIFVTVVLILASIFGLKFIGLFGISLAAFSVAGGVVLFSIGMSMMNPAKSISQSEQTGEGPSTAEQGNSLSPLILFAASPGSITGVITIGAAHAGGGIPTTAIVAVIVVLVLTWLLVLASIYMPQEQKSGGIARDMISRYMGLIVVAMGIQFALTGFKTFMTAGGLG
ncbi:MAG: MarC family protein [Paracoccaceae bacterium]